MKVIETDRRRITYGETPTAIEAATRAAEKRSEANVELARALLEIDRCRGYVRYGCSSVAMWARRLGLAPPEVSQLLAFARALEADNSVEERVQAKAMSVPAAAAIAPLLENEALFEEHDHWIDRAQRAAYSSVRKEARQRLAEIRCGEAVVEVRVHVPDSVNESFDRAGVIASDKAGRSLTAGETFETVVDHYLDTFDPRRTAEGTRRTGPTEDEPGKRYIPVSVRRAIRRRAGDRCEYPGCLHRKFLQFAHRRPWRFGSGREANDLFLLCYDHHTFLDAEFVLAIGPTRDPKWIDNYGLITTRDDLDGREPETERERRVVRALEVRRANPNRRDRESRVPKVDVRKPVDRPAGERVPNGRRCGRSRDRESAGPNGPNGAGGEAEPLFASRPSS